MNAFRRHTVPVLLLTLVGGQTISRSDSDRESGTPSSRLIAASISVDGVVVLRASTSDDGHPDADTVWNYLLKRLEFRPTKDFAKAKIDADAENVQLGWLRGAATKHLGKPPEFELSVSYGGRDRPFRIHLERGAKKRTWRVARKTVEGRFRHRWITRMQAANLAAPKRKKESP